MQRSKLPLVVIDLDGGLGFWDEHKTYHLRHNFLSILVTMAVNFRLVAVSFRPQSRKMVRKLCKRLQSRSFVFDAVY